MQVTAPTHKMEMDSEITDLEGFSLEPISSFTKPTLHLSIPLLYKPEFRARGKYVLGAPTSGIQAEGRMPWYYHATHEKLHSLLGLGLVTKSTLLGPFTNEEIY